MLKHFAKLFNKFFGNYYVIIPSLPSRELLVSMAMREDHAFLMSSGMSDKDIEEYKNKHPIMAGQFYTSEEREYMIRKMSSLHEEVAGRGFFTYWNEENNNQYKIAKK